MSYLRTTLLLSQLLFAESVSAATCEVRVGLAGERRLCWQEVSQAWVSEDCLSRDCEALKATGPQAPVLHPGGHNPGALACQKLGEKVTILRDKTGNEQSFCEFGDRSLVSTSALGRSK